MIKKSKLPIDWPMVALAFGIALLASLLALPWSWLNVAGAFLGAAVSTFLLLLLARPLGRLLQQFVWRTHGGALQRVLLRIAAKRYGATNIFITGRPERKERGWVRVLETTALVAGVEAMGISWVPILMPYSFAIGLSTIIALLAFWVTFLVTPLWSFARLGIRRVDAPNFIVTPLARLYGRTTRLADGAFFLLAVSLSVAALRRLGETDDAAYRQVLLIALNLGSFAVLIISRALQHDDRHASASDEALVAHAIGLGCVDARGDDELQLAARLAEQDPSG